MNRGKLTGFYLPLAASVLLVVLVVVLVAVLAGCTTPAAPASAPAAPVQPQAYMTVTVTRGCDDGAVTVQVSHIQPVSVALVRRAIETALASRAEQRLASQAVCHD